MKTNKNYFKNLSLIFGKQKIFVTTPVGRVYSKSGEGKYRRTELHNFSHHFSNLSPINYQNKSNSLLNRT